MSVYCSLTWNVFREAVAKFYKVKHLIKKTKDKWNIFDEWELFQKKAMLNWKNFLRVREAYVFPLPFGELASKVTAFREGAGWGWGHTASARRKQANVALKVPSLHPASSARALNWMCCSQESSMTKRHTSLITTIGISSFLYVEWRWMGPEHVIFSLFSCVSDLNHRSMFIDVKNCTST